MLKLVFKQQNWLIQKLLSGNNSGSVKWDILEEEEAEDKGIGMKATE